MYTGSSFALAHPAHTAAQASAPAPAKHEFTFHDFLSIINPLQHLPVIGTLYRAATGDTIKTPEKIAGDTLYGGPLGGISAVADALFQESTGKSFGDTVMGWLGFHHDAKPVEVAQASASDPVKTSATVTPAPAQPAARPADANALALTDSLQRNQIAPDLAQRALFAYRRSSMGTSPSAFAAY